MSRKSSSAEATDSFGGDSFLDVISNMVGILIILVMVAGLRVKNAVESPPVDAPPKADLAPLRVQAAQLKEDVHAVFAQAGRLNELALARMQERDALALAVAAREADVDHRKRALADADREAFELKSAAESDHLRLASLQREFDALAAEVKTESIKLKTYPTPISRTVFGREAHFQLKDGRIEYVPIQELAEEVKREVQRKAYRLQDLDAVTENAGPVGGFRVRYVLEKMQVQPHPVPGGVHPGGVVIGVTEITFLPVSSQLGETLDVALEPQSNFQRVLSDLDPRRVTITLWTYPENFAQYRALREYLYQRGFSVAGRPLDTGTPISGSPNGSKSAAQ